MYWDNKGHFVLVFSKGIVYQGILRSNGAASAESPYYE